MNLIFFTHARSSHARNAGIIPPITLHDYIDNAQALIDDINNALKAFEDAVANFKCIDCSIEGPYSEHIRAHSYIQTRRRV